MTSKRTPRRILAQPYDYSVQDIVDKIESGDIDLNPDYQRNYVWDSNDEEQNKCSRLIESLLLNIPIPVIYFAEQAETLKYEVIDGQQRLHTFKRFLKDEFALKNLQLRDDVNDKKYSELDQRDRDEIRKRSIRAIVILNESDDEVKYEVFERLNLGSIQLTPQEIRNNTLRGDFNILLKELADNDLFKRMLKLRLKNDDKNMAREELVLRFFAYHDSGYKRVVNLSYFLTDYMKRNQNPTKETLSKLKNLFIDTIKLVDKFLGEKAFSNFGEKTGRWASLSNRSLYDAEMLAFAAFVGKTIKITPDTFIKKLEDLMIKSEFRKSLHANAGGKMIEKRVSEIKNIISSSEA
ncbi:GmrSD restriction endonuclease domain-containing protein [Nitrosomonas ureae]|uniref:Uncharacterized protein DUF262 n=1 Tax=Nitrosomonas ureae TaxID=44577 RepID=A0A2T5IRM7_9PROT|nr:DUF262 domain-containing protein [Nitrosomonas ureae]PTQ86483.1 uncharacterized protein DUF262 [Nitrosomonas ureae]